MPDLPWNVRLWSEGYDWSGRGEEWSESWGSSAAQWSGTIYPRISTFLPATAILEIAPGFGRWTRFLLHQCKSYIGVDLSFACVAHCGAQFQRHQHACFHLNDGLSLPMVGDNTCDFVFSFDSLVHAEIDVLRNYIGEILRVLRGSGVSFIHHSNWLGAQTQEANRHFRAETVSAQLVHDIIHEFDGMVLLQEVVTWGSVSCIDCFTLFGSAAAYKHHEPYFLRNPQFMEEADLIRKYQQPWHAIKAPYF